MNAALFCSRTSIFSCGQTHDGKGGEEERLSDEGRRHVDDTGDYKKTDQGKEKAEAIRVQLNGRIEELQECLYANGTRSVLITRVHGLVSDKVVRQRFKQIKEFEELIYESGTTILKFFLHISKEEQKERLGWASQRGSDRDAVPPLFSLAGQWDRETISLQRGVDPPRYRHYGFFLLQPLRWYSAFQDLELVDMFYAGRAIAGEINFPH